MLRVVGGITASTSKETRRLVELGLIGRLAKALETPYAEVKKNVVWIFSNLAAESSDYTQTLIEAGIMKKLTKLAMLGSYEIRRECMWTLANAAVTAKSEQAKLLLELKVVEILCLGLTMQDVDTVMAVLEGLKCLLKSSEVTV